MQGQRELSTNSSEYNAQDFMVRRLLAEINTAEPVRVTAVDVPAGVSPVGYVDVLPLVNLITGERRGQAQSVLYRLPYLRVQGGRNAVIVDPQPGDVGLAVYAMRDTEAVKDGRSGPVNPGSARSLSKSDGFYLGGYLNGAPERYVRVTDEGVAIEGVANIDMHGATTTINAESGCTVNAAAGVTINGDVLINGSLTWTGTAQGRGGAARFSGGLSNAGGRVESNGLTLETHVHGGVEPGPGATGGPL